MTLKKGIPIANSEMVGLLAQKPFIVPIPGTTKWAHLQENLSAADYVFSSGELNNLTAKIDQIPIVGDRLSGLSAEQTQK